VRSLPNHLSFILIGEHKFQCVQKLSRAADEKSGDPRVAHHWRKHFVDANLSSDNLGYQQALWASFDKPTRTGEKTSGRETFPNAVIFTN
jgi:hypothetical protein